jgi:hypothetical protein
LDLTNNRVRHAYLTLSTLLTCGIHLSTHEMHIILCSFSRDGNSPLLARGKSFYKKEALTRQRLVHRLVVCDTANNSQ